MYVFILLIFFSIYHIKSGPVGFFAWVATARAFLLVQLPKDDVSRRPSGCDLPKCLKVNFFVLHLMSSKIYVHTNTH